MKKILAIIISLMLVVGIISAVSISASAETTDLSDLYSSLVFPEPFPYTTEGFGVDTDAILACFPQDLEVSFENGIYKVESLGFTEATVFEFANSKTKEMTLSDGYFSVERTDEEKSAGCFIYFNEVAENGISLRVQYRSGFLDMIMLSSDRRNIQIYSDGDVIFPFEVIEGLDFKSYYNKYVDGNLIEQRADGWVDEYGITNNYHADGTYKFTQVWNSNTGKSYYYSAEHGWTDDSLTATNGEAPEIYKDFTAEDFMALVPYNNGSISEPEEPETPAEFIELPEVVIPDEMPKSLTEAGIDTEALWNAAPAEIEIFYENGFMKVKNFGIPVDYVYCAADSQHRYPTLEGNYYLVEMPEDVFEGGLSIYFEDDNHSLGYVRTKLNTIQYREKDSDGLTKKVYAIFVNGDCQISYYLDEFRTVEGQYSNDLLMSQEAHNVVYNHSVAVEYYTDGTLCSARFMDWDTREFFYYFVGKGWSASLYDYEPIDAPEAFKNYTEGQIMELSPSLGLCQHQWIDATCIAAKSCEKCGLWDGELKDHSFVDATCEAPKTCSVCFATEGDALGHDFADATCTAPKTCSVCFATEGDALGHSFADATCEAPKTCTVCNETEGDALGHDFADATTEAPKTCKNCGETEGEPLPEPVEPEAPTTEPGESEKTEEPNWFVKLWNAIIDFFRRLFGIK